MCGCLLCCYDYNWIICIFYVLGPCVFCSVQTFFSHFVGCLLLLLLFFNQLIVSLMCRNFQVKCSPKMTVHCSMYDVDSLWISINCRCLRMEVWSNMFFRAWFLEGLVLIEGLVLGGNCQGIIGCVYSSPSLFAFLLSVSEWTSSTLCTSPLTVSSLTKKKKKNW